MRKKLVTEITKMSQWKRKNKYDLGPSSISKETYDIAIAFAEELPRKFPYPNIFTGTEHSLSLMNKKTPFL